MALEFHDAPPPKAQTGKAMNSDGHNDPHLEARNELKANPGKWAVLFEDTKPSKASQYKAKPRWAGFEFTSRKTEQNTPGNATIWARYTGDVTP